jgi:hypothetical protein
MIKAWEKSFGFKAHFEGFLKDDVIVLYCSILAVLGSVYYQMYVNVSHVAFSVHFLGGTK